MSTRNYRWLVGCICGAAALVSGLVHSQTSNGDPPDNDIGGNDSPSGVSGGFNGMVNTACAYDPYTGNARRVIDDIIVPGSLGAYPLKWTRFYNSRDPDIGNALGIGWRHSYLWSEDYYGGDVVHFPDGREIDFNEATGIAERLPQVGQLKLGDGGQVIFEPVPYNLPNGQYVRYRVARIIDPYGLATIIRYDNAGTDNNGNAIYRISRITEPGGRYLLLNYSATDGTQISGVQAFTADNNLTQSVSYAYSSMSAVGGVYPTLTAASYSDGTTAQYTYQDDNSGKNGSPKIPLLRTCDDVRYSGAMRQIDYLFVRGDRIRGKIKSELKAGSGEAVSTLTFPSGRAAQNRVEMRGDGPKRKFSYSASGRLLSYTDFKNDPSIATVLTYDANNFVGAVTDAGNHQTIYTKEPVTGRATRVLFADQTSHVDFDYGDPNSPYYLWTRTDEKQHTTYFYRDANHRVQQINYPGPDIPYETFAYNNFGQVLTHRRTNGFYEHFVYDGAGHLRKAWNPTANATWPPSDAEPHMEFDYYPNGHPWADRVSTVKDQRGYSTAYEYDRDNASQPCAGPGLVTRVTHLVDGTYISFAYDQFGNVIAAENELRKRTNFAYDDYSRVITVTPPAPAGAMTFTYERYGTSDPYLHATRAVHLQTDGAGVTVEKRYDENFRPNALIQQDGTASPPTRTLEYWPVGLLKTVHDPRNLNWTTNYTYTARNQVETVTDAQAHQTLFHYDPAGNVDYIRRPDNRVVNRSYDEMNRVWLVVEPVTDNDDKTTTFTYWPSGLVRTVQDDNGQITTFEYDASDLQKRMVYPDGASYQEWTYDQAKNLIARRTVGGKTQLFYPDGRNRITDTLWDETSNVSDWAHFDYDSANQLIGAQNQTGTIARTYDDAGRLLTEEQNVTGLGPKTVSYGSDGAGKRTALGLVATDYQFAFHYDPLGRLDQLLKVQSSANANTNSLWYEYSYDAASNQTERFCLINGVTQTYARDNLGRIANVTVKNRAAPQWPGTPQVPVVSDYVDTRRFDQLVRNALQSGADAANQAAPIGTIINSEDYVYDPMSRVTDVSRNERRNDKQITGHDQFGYDDAGALRHASYTETIRNETWIRTVDYTQDNLGNRSLVTDNGNPQGYSRNSTYLNQYVSGPAGAISNGVEHETAGYEGLSYTYFGDRNLASVTGNGNSYNAAYDAVGRCVKRTLNGTTIYYSYDGPHPIYEWTAQGATAGWNVYGQAIDEILLRADYVIVPNGQGYFFQQNRLGSVTHLTGFFGEVIEAYHYDAFGAPITTETHGSFNNRFKFTGREYQPAFGIYEYRNRAYHPGLGRFLSEDPMGFAAGDTNLFRYCGGDPVNWTDPYGLWTIQIGLSVTFQFGPVAAGWSGGFAFDGHGNIGTYNGPHGGLGLGARASGGLSVLGSNADTIYGLAGAFKNAGLGAGLGPSGALQAFWGDDAITGEPVVGGGFTLGPGAGGGFFGGLSHTQVFPLFPLFPSNSSGSSNSSINGLGWTVPRNLIPRNGYYSVEVPDQTATFGYRIVDVGIGDTVPDPSAGRPYHYGTTGNLIWGAGAGQLGYFNQSLTSTGGGDWQTVIPWEIGGQPGEGFHSVPYELF